MYDRGKGIGIVERPTPQRNLLLAYVRSVLVGQEALDQERLWMLIGVDRPAGS